MRFRNGEEVPEGEASAKGRMTYSSSHYDIAAYEADGGDMAHRYQQGADGSVGTVMNPGRVDEGLWDKAKRASEEAFGRIRYPFVTWWYKKQGGTFG